MFPAVSYSFEPSELDIMTRIPRSPNDHLVTKKLLTFAYLQMGFIQTCGGFVTYFIVFKEFGFGPSALNRIITKPYFPHNLSDKFDPTKPFFGNTAVECQNGRLVSLEIKGDHERSSLIDGNDDGKGVDWLFTNDLAQDLRMGYLTSNCSDPLNPAKQSIEFDKCSVFQISPISLRPVCFSTEALKYAQTAFFFSIVFCQFVNTICCKSRKLSFTSQGLDNDFMALGWTVEFTLCFVLAYLRPINHVFGTRDLIFLQWGLYSLFYAMMLLLYEEIRKFLIRNFPSPKNMPNWFERNTLY
jgi:sodium/potassium-transporting ATPase subunit alpha